VDDCGVGVYFEPDGGLNDLAGPVLIRSNQLVNVDFGVFLLLHPGSRCDSVTCLGNEIVLTGSGGFGLGACDTCAGTPGGSITDLTALGNVVRYPEWTLHPTKQDSGLHASDIRHAVFGNNVIVQGTTNELRVRHFPAGQVIPTGPPEECGQLEVPPPGEPYYLPSLDVLPPGYRRAWFNNRSLSGALLEVRTANWDVDRPAAQQQWPD
jgi:hypothetical protein